MNPEKLLTGDGDATEERPEANQVFRDKLISWGADVTWSQYPDYGHEWRIWDMEIEKFMDWLPRTNGYANAGRRQI